MSLVHSEWTKFRTVRGWVIGLIVGAAAIVGLGLIAGGQGSCGTRGPGSECVLPVGPDGIEVADAFYFVRQPLTGDGRITARVASLSGRMPEIGGPEDPPGGREGVVPWAKAGLIIKDGTRAGSAYAAVMLTGAHGVRMQHNYLYDTAGPTSPADQPVWLRLVRSGETITGESSVDGVRWASVGSARLTGLPSTVEIGLFVTSPQYAEEVEAPFGSKGAAGGPSRATAVFDHVDQSWPVKTWTDGALGGSDNMPAEILGGFQRSGDTYTVSGSGDIAPATAGAAGFGLTVTQTLAGTFAGLIAIVVVATLFVTGEYRRGLIRTTLAATPARLRVLAAKAAVVAGVTFALGLAAAAIVVTAGQSVLRNNGVYVHPVTVGTELRLVVGTAALLALAAVLALAIGVLVRRSAAAVAIAIVATVLPYLLVMTVLPTGTGQWVLRVTPAAAFAVQQSTPQYDQVANLYIPANGYFPLQPWAGFAVLVGWTALALGLAALAVRRRDA